MLKVTFLGVTSAQTDKYETTSFVLDSGEAKILVDTGPGLARQLDKAGISATGIDAVIVTHAHGDHVAGFAYFIFKTWILKGRGSAGPVKLALIALPEVYKGLMDMLSFQYPQIKPPATDITYWPADSRKQSRFKIKNVTITTTPVVHALPCIGVRFDSEGKSVAFSSDTAYTKNMVELAKDSDLLIHEAAATTGIRDLLVAAKHSGAEDAAIVAKESRTKRLMLTHVFPEYMDRQQELIAEVKKNYSGEVRIPKELEVVDL